MPWGWTILVLALVGVSASTLLGWRVWESRQAEARLRFDRLAERAVSAVHDRLTRPLYGLRGARALYAASERVTRAEFAAFVAARDLPIEFPGVRGFGVIRWVGRADLPHLIATERADDAPDFAVRTGGEAEDCFVITVIEPAARNRPAIGLDIGSEARRRAAAEAAVASGGPALSRSVVLVQDGRQGPGFLLLLPVFAKGGDGLPGDLVCLVYSPIVVGEIMAGVEVGLEGQADLLLHDGPSVADPVIYDADGATDLATGTPDAERHPASVHHRVLPVTVADRTLTVQIRATPAFLVGIDPFLPLAVGVGGSL
ncbi:MAG: hypothetical protein RLZZ127_2320, partial [Planctomycetota bacterium]